MTSTPEPDPQLLAAEGLARAALLEITPAATVGDVVGSRNEGEGLLSLLFATTLLGYPGWLWTVTLARVDDAEPTVVEVELMPGEGALLAPEWVPWAERLAEYEAQQRVERAAEGDADADDDASDDDEDDADDDEDASDDDLDEDDDVDADDDDDEDDSDDEDKVGDVTPVLHSGDVDGVDIDELDEAAGDDEDDELDDEDDDERERLREF